MFCFVFWLYSEKCNGDDNLDESDTDEMQNDSQSVNNDLEDLLLDSDHSRPSSRSSSRPTSSLSFSHEVMKQIILKTCVKLLMQIVHLCSFQFNRTKQHQQQKHQQLRQQQHGSRKKSDSFSTMLNQLKPTNCINWPQNFFSVATFHSMWLTPFISRIL